MIPDASNNPSFTLTGGEGMIVYAILDKDISFSSVSCAPIALRQGSNLAGLPCSPPGYSAYQFLDALGIENIISVQRYYAEIGYFETAGFDESGEIGGSDFAIIPGEAFFINMKKDYLFDLQ
jgi:hypothetical protein